MNLPNLSLVKAINTKLSWLDARQKVLARNISHADTPGYRGRDLKPLQPTDFRSALRATQLEPARTSASHLGQLRPGDANHRDREERQPYEVVPDGNTVTLEDQMMKASKTAMDHRMTTSLYGRAVGLIRMSLNGGN